MYRLKPYVQNIYFVIAVSSALTSQAAEKIIVGHAANFSNVSNSVINPYNNAVTNGLNFALSEHESALRKKGLEIEVKNFDYGNSEIQALETAKKIVSSRVQAVIGFYESGQSLLGSPVLAKAHIPLISPLSSATRLFGQDPHFHPMSFSNASMGLSLAKFAAKKLHAKRALVIPAADCAYCTDLGESFIKGAKHFNIQIEKVNVLNEEPDLSSIDVMLKKRKFDVIVVPNHELTSAKIIAHLLKSGVRVPFLGGDGWVNAQGSGFFQIVTERSFEGYCVGHWHPDMATKTGLRFIAEWKKRYGKIPTADSAIAYDSMKLLIIAILNAPDLSRNGIQKSLESVREFDGATGDLYFKGGGQPPEKSLVILKSNMKVKDFVPFRIFDPKE